MQYNIIVVMECCELFLLNKYFLESVNIEASVCDVCVWGWGGGGECGGKQFLFDRKLYYNDFQSMMIDCPHF